MIVLLKALLVLAFLAASMPASAGKVLLGFTVHYTVKNATAFDAKIDRVGRDQSQGKLPCNARGTHARRRS